MARIVVERTIAASPDRVLNWMADPANLLTAPLTLKAGYGNGFSGPGKGAVRQVTAVGGWFREEFTAYDPPHSYSYRIVGSIPPFKHDGGTLTFTPAASETKVVWVSVYTHPAYCGGRLLAAITRPMLIRSFQAILDGCARALS